MTSAEASHVSSDSSRDSGTSPVSPSPVFTQNQERSPAVRDEDFKAVARAAKKKSRSSPPPSLNYLVPVVAALFIGGAAVTQLGKSLVLRGGAQHEAAPSPHLLGTVSLKNIPLPGPGALPAVDAPLALPSPPAPGAPPAVGAPLALPAPAAPPTVDAASRSFVAPLRASAAGQSAVATGGLTPTKLLECIALQWGKERKHAGGFLQSRFKRRLSLGTTFSNILQECLKGEKIDLTSFFDRDFIVWCANNQWLLVNEQKTKLKDSLPALHDTGPCEFYRVKNMNCSGKTESGDFVYHVHRKCLAYFLDTLNILAITCELAVKGLASALNAYCAAYSSDCPILTTESPYDPNVPNGTTTVYGNQYTAMNSPKDPNSTTTVYGNQYPAVNPTTNALAFPHWAIAVSVILPVVFLLLIVANAIRIIQKRSKANPKDCANNHADSLLSDDP
eukprot:GHVT01067313.1.p1 GENE.GHVT01067313.1~~GHVT01067313.1.p1  ORF type:complete len:447 (-),score=49.06 GHVT01067313.1:108-1448(-)